MSDFSVERPRLGRLVVGTAAADSEIRRWTVIGTFIVIATFGLGLGGSAITPLSSAVVATGAVKVDTSRKKVQHFEGGVIKEILVADGSVVRAGDVLVRLDETRAGAAHGVVKGGREVALATQARLEAERDDRPFIRFPVALSAGATNPQVADTLRSQESIFAARRSSRAGELGIVDRQIIALRSEITGFQAQQRSKEERIESLRRELEGLSTLLREGMVEKTRVRAIERDIAQLIGERDELASKIASTHTSISEKELRKFQVRKIFQEEVVAELKKVQAENFELIERESATRHALKLTELRSPVDGTVTDLKVHTAGGVVGPGEVLMELVPIADRLIVEAKVAPSDIDRVAIGQSAGIKLHAFDTRTTPELDGSVHYVSADAVVDPRSDQSHFVVKIVVAQSELGRLGTNKVQPGMQGDVFIRTGERTILEYLILPLSDSFRKAWRER